MVRLLKFGTHLGARKMDALLRGDQSNAVLDRAFVRGSHVLGMMALASDTPGMVRLHARRVQMAWEALAELFERSDHGTRVQAAILVVSSHVYMCMPQMAQLYIQKICDIIKAGELQFVPPCGRPPEFSEELHENLGALSQAIYWANYLFLMCGGPEPRTTAKLEKEFRRELQVGGSPSASLYIKFIFYVTAHLSHPLRDMSADDANTRHFTCQGRNRAPRHPCHR